MKNETSPNDPAFPESGGDLSGLTKREYFAAMAMQGLLSNEDSKFRVEANDGTVGEAALKNADALIAELNK